MRNPVPRSNLFVTPASEQDLFDRIESLPRADRALAYQIAMFTFNLAHSLVQKEIQETVDA